MAKIKGLYSPGCPSPTDSDVNKNVSIWSPIFSFVPFVTGISIEGNKEAFPHTISAFSHNKVWWKRGSVKADPRFYTLLGHVGSEPR